MSVLFLPPSAGAASIPDASETVKGKIRIATSAEATAGTDDLTSMTPLKVKSVVDAALVGGVTYQGTFDASSPADLSNASKGDLYIISVAGSYQGQDWAVGDHLLINADMGGTLDPNKIDKVDNTDSVTSVAGRTGAVVLSASDVSGLATVATTGAYSDLTGTPTLGTAAAEDVGTSAGNVVQLNGSAQLPAVDGSLLTGITASVAALDDVGDVTITSAADGQFLKYDSASGDWVNGDSGLYAYHSFSTTGTLATPAQPQTLVVSLSSSLSQTLTLPTGSNDFVGTSISIANLNSGDWTIAAASGNYIRGLSTAPTLAQNQAIILTLASFNTWLVVAYEEQGLGSLLDVSITSPSNGEALIYNSTSGDWENGTVSASVAALDDIGDVDTTGVSTNNVLKYDGANWVDGSVAYSEVTGTPTLATVATSGAYSDLSGTPTLATVATTGAYSDLTGTPTLGTAAALDVGTSASNVVQLNGSAQLPAVDGSLLTGITASVAALDDVGDVNITSVQDYAVLKYDSGTSEWIDAPQINYVYTSTTQSLDLKPGVNRVTMAGASSITLTLGITSLVAAQGAVFSVLSTGSATNTLTIGSSSWNFDQHQGGVFVATGLNTAYMVSTIDYNQLENLPTLGTAAALDVGTSAGNVVQLNGSAQLPAVDGSLLTNISATVAALNDVGDVSAAAPSNGDVIKYNSTSGDWENGSVAYSEVTGTPTLATVATTGAYSDLTGAPDVPVLENNYVTSTSTATAISEDGHYAYWLGNGNTGLITLTLPAQSGGVVAYLTFTNQDSSTDHAVSLSSGQFRLSGGVSATSLSIPAGSTRSFYYYSVSYWELSSNELNELGDVTITTPANGEALIYNSTSGDWENGTVSATVAALNDIGDVSAAAPNNGDVIAYNSTSGDWEATAQSGGGSAPSVTVSSPSTDQTLSAPSGIEEAYIYTPSANITVNLVAAATCGSGFKYQIKNRSTNTITIDPNGAETIDGAATFDIATQEASVTLITDGSNWFII